MKVPVRNFYLVLFCREKALALRLLALATSRIPLSPTADGADVYVIDTGRASIARSEGPNQPLMVVKKDRIVVVRKNIVSARNECHSLVKQPLRRSTVVSRHDAKGQSFSLDLRLFDDTIDKIKVIRSLGRFKSRPRPTKICHG